MSIDLGTKPSKPEPATAEKPSYPTICFRDEQVAKLVEQLGEDPDVGDEGTLTIKWRCTGRRSDEYGKTTDLQVLSLENSGDVTEEEPETETEAPEEEPSGGMKMKNPAARKAMGQMMGEKRSGKTSGMGMM